MAYRIGCRGCERRRKEMAIMADAGREWMKAPLGPPRMTIYARLLEAAKARGEFDGLDGPNT